MLAALGARLHRFSYVSLDIFDTALLRAVAQPRDAFLLLGQQAGDARFPALREEAERLARKRAWDERRAAEVTLDEIYAQLQHPRGAELRALELRLEEHLCRRNDAIYALYQACREMGKPVLFTSDMYLPIEFIRSLLLRAGYEEYHRLYVSSALQGLTKATGTLYQHLLQELGCPPESVLHIGDNWDSDVLAARKAGLRSYYYERCHKRYLRLGPRPLLAAEAPESAESAESVDPEEAAAASLHTGQCARVTQSPRRTLGAGSSASSFWYRFGYQSCGPLYYGFGRWLVQQVQQLGAERVVFLARDGYILKQVYELLAPSGAPPAQYLYASRRAFNVPAITALDEPAMNFLCSGTTVLSAGQFLARVGLEPGRYAAEARAAGLTAGLDQTIRSGAEYASLRQLFHLVQGDLLASAAEERAMLLRYLAQEDLLRPARLALVDLGWHGSLQRSLSRILRMAEGPAAELCGLYLGTFPRAKDLMAEGHELRGYLCNAGEPADLLAVIQSCVEVFEFIHSAPHGSVLRFQSQDGRVVPVLGPLEVPASQQRKAAELQRGALAFCRDFAEHHAVFPWLRITPAMAVAPLGATLRRPSREEARQLGDLLHSEGFGDVLRSRPIAQLPPLQAVLRNPMSLHHGIQQSFWAEGYRQRLCGDSRWLRRALSLGAWAAQRLALRLDR